MVWTTPEQRKGDRVRWTKGNLGYNEEEEEWKDNGRIEKNDDWESKDNYDIKKPIQ
jgi:hypothetical protein